MENKEQIVCLAQQKKTSHKCSWHCIFVWYVHSFRFPSFQFSPLENIWTSERTRREDKNLLPLHSVALDSSYHFDPTEQTTLSACLRCLLSFFPSTPIIRGCGACRGFCNSLTEQTKPKARMRWTRDDVWWQIRKMNNEKRETDCNSTDQRENQIWVVILWRAMEDLSQLETNRNEKKGAEIVIWNCTLPFTIQNGLNNGTWNEREELIRTRDISGRGNFIQFSECPKYFPLNHDGSSNDVKHDATMSTCMFNSRICNVMTIWDRFCLLLWCRLLLFIDMKTDE